MHPSVQTLVLTLSTLAIGGAEGLKFQKRAGVADTSDAQGAQNLLITNDQQTLFYTPMQFGSGNGAVNLYGLVSTTRGDIILPGAYAKNATKYGFVDQGKSVAEGPIWAGPVSAAGWTVPDQDIIYYENSGAPLPIKAEGECAYAGFGIWPNTSTIAQAFGDWSADSLIARILAEPETGLYWTLLINPLEDDRGTDESFGGVLTIGEIVNVTQIFDVTQEDIKKYDFPDLKLVAEYPWLNHSASYNGIPYYAIIDAISCGNGTATLKSTVPGTPDGKISAYIDSTYSWIQVPYSVTEQLYKNLPGATYMKDTRLWHFECTELNINITIAGYDYPLSPLTAVQRSDGLKCVGTFQAGPENAGGDVVLGVPFLKNVYARFSYGSRRDGEVYDPYVQLMPITDIEDAHHDWETWHNKWASGSLGGQHSPFPSSLSSLPSPSSSGLLRHSSSTLLPPSSNTHHSPSSTTLHSPSSTTPPSHSPSTPPSHSPSLPTPSSPSSSASDPLATGGSNKVTGAVEDDGNEEKSDPVKRNLPAIIAGSVLGGLALIGGIIFVLMRMRNGRDGKGAYRGLEKPDDGAGPVKVPLYDAEGGSGRYGDGGQGRYTDPYKD